MTATQTQLDFGRKMRDKGIKKAADSAEEISPGWNEKAFKYLKWFVDTRKPGERFLAEDIRKDAGTLVPQPPSDRAWGGVLRRAATTGIICRVGYSEVKNEKAHRAIATVWMKK